LDDEIRHQAKTQEESSLIDARRTSNFHATLTVSTKPAKACTTQQKGLPSGWVSLFEKARERIPVLFPIHHYFLRIHPNKT